MKKVVIGIIITLSIMLILFLLKGELLVIDEYVEKIVYKFDGNDLYINFMLLVSFFGSALFLILLTFGCLWYSNKKEKYFIPLNLTFIFLLNIAIKEIVSRSRPDLFLVLERGYSFPSGHAMVSTAFYGFLIIYIHNSARSKLFKEVSETLLIITVILISLSRIALNVHYFSDVLVGILISLSYLYFIKCCEHKLFKS